jgi:hypothetical protein
MRAMDRTESIWLVALRILIAWLLPSAMLGLGLALISVLAR